MEGCSPALLNVPIPPDSSPCQSSKGSALIILMGHLHIRTLGLKFSWNSHRRVLDRVQSLFKSP